MILSLFVRTRCKLCHTNNLPLHCVGTLIKEPANEALEHVQIVRMRVRVQNDRQFKAALTHKRLFGQLRRISDCMAQPDGAFAMLGDDLIQGHLARMARTLQRSSPSGCFQASGQSIKEYVVGAISV